MSLPTSVFLDTSVLAGQQYNFTSAALASFVPVAARHSLVFLLPDPTEREIRRQIEERSQEALNALEEARRRAPFLAKWEHFPSKNSTTLSGNWKVRQVAFQEWKAFLGQFNVQKLNYEGVDVAEVMRWYDHVTPPFREGKKRKEFPDAFAIAILSTYAAKTHSTIAIVSEDTDFKLACDRYPSLLYFKSLPILTELLLAPPEEIESLKASVLTDISSLIESISDAVAELHVVHEDEIYEIDDTKVINVSINNIHVVAIGHKECTFTFEADVEIENQLIWREWNHEYDEYSTEKKWINEVTFVSGVAKVSLDADNHMIKNVLLVSLNQDFLEASEIPHIW